MLFIEPCAQIDEPAALAASHRVHQHATGARLDFFHPAGFVRGQTADSHKPVVADDRDLAVAGDRHVVEAWVAELGGSLPNFPLELAGRRGLARRRPCGEGNQ